MNRQGKNTASVLAGIKAAVSVEILSAGPLFTRYDSLEQVSERKELGREGGKEGGSYNRVNEREREGE